MEPEKEAWRVKKRSRLRKGSKHRKNVLPQTDSNRGGKGEEEKNTTKSATLVSLIWGRCSSRERGKGEFRKRLGVSSSKQ